VYAVPAGNMTDVCYHM